MPGQPRVVSKGDFSHRACTWRTRGSLDATRSPCSNTREETWVNQLHSLEPLDVLRPTGNAAESVRKDYSLLIQQTRQTLRAGRQSTGSRVGGGRCSSRTE